MDTKWTRRALLGGGATLAGMGGLTFAAYRQFPLFFEQYAREMNLPVEPAPKAPNPKTWPDRGLHAAWLGHSTVLVKVDGFTFLTDPVFSTRAGLNFGPITLGVKRRVEAALRITDLPAVDLVLVSHAHMDHLDQPSLRKLEGNKTHLIMAPETSDLVRAGRYAAVKELRWDEEIRVGPATIRAFAVNHWGARMRTDTYRGYVGYLLEIGSRRILFAGDTALTDSFHSLRRSREIDLAIMPIGAYNPWIRYHCTPEQAVKMANDCGAGRLMPVHHQTFHLSREPLQEPIERFLAANRSTPGRVVLKDIGEECH
ncbi:MAG: MBL fold metallo-hydrolase, partial [Bryobacteraceae bacterium]|nr:MBL fold metallo-hydrolase [Bryobacteraceae bacterium]